MSKSKERIRDSQLRYKQGLGQNFIYDEDLLASLVRAAGVTKEDDVLEVGPGAGSMTKHLCKAAHHVLSGIAFCYYDAQGNQKQAVSHASTAVHFGPMSKDDVQLYLDSGEPYDKAGAYAIQGLAGRWITGIEGDYFNVVGLPVNVMCELAKQAFGIDLLRL